MWARSGDGLSVPGNLGIYTPLQQHSQCGKNNAQSKKNWQKEKGITRKEKPVDQWKVLRWDRFKCPPKTSVLHENYNGLHGMYLGDVWCGSRPSSWSLHPSNKKIGLKMHGNGATRIAYPAFYSFEE
jgi:hypothetical protein